VKTFKQYHYTTWPDRNVPDNPGFILAFRDKVTGDTESLDGPILVHCRSVLTVEYTRNDVLDRHHFQLY